MRKNDHPGIRYVVLFLVLVLVLISKPGMSQSSLPEILLNGSVREQMEYIQEKTRIYEEYRAIREDMFQKIKRNTLDSLSSAKNEIVTLKNSVSARNSGIDSLNSEIVSVKADLDKMTRTKNSMSFMGIEIGKAAYNTIVWMIIGALSVLLVTGFLSFKRSRAVNLQTKKEIDELKKEFEAYRKASREAREKMSMAHFNELKRLRGA